MYEIASEVRLAAAHRLREMEGEGELLHGHAWRVRAYVRAGSLDARGVVMDFADLERALVAVTERFRSVNLNDVPPFDSELNPTAENLARFVAEELERRMAGERARVHRVEVWETDTCAATYLP